MTEPSRYAERLILYLMMLLAVIAWIGLGGLIFVGILTNTTGA